MKFKLVLGLMFLVFCMSANFAQTQLTIKKKSSMKIAGLPEMPKMPAGTANPMDSMNNRKSTVYIKGSRMRSDLAVKDYSTKKDLIMSTIVQCDKQRQIQFNSKKKKYFVDPIAAPASKTTKNSTKGGYVTVTVTGSVTDTGERAKLFGYDARHLKQTITFTPSKNACMKDAMQIEMEGWYADIPEFSCPIQRNMSEFKMDKNCFDDVDFQIKGSITGVPLKEIKKMTTQGMTIIMEEEATEILKTPLADSLFDPPTDYKAANTLKEVEDDSPDNSSSGTNPANVNPQNSSRSNTPSPTFSLPQGGIEKPPLTDKKTGMIRIGIAKPKVTTPDSKKNPDASEDIATAATNLLVESLKAENVEAIQLETDFPENECKEKGCDYILSTNITQKRGGGGMFGKIIPMVAMTAASVFIPGIGGMIAGTAGSVVMNQTMGKTAKAKDEFTLDYKVVGMDKSMISQAVTKRKTEKDGEDALTPQIQQASKTVLEKIKK